MRDGLIMACFTLGLLCFLMAVAVSGCVPEALANAQREPEDVWLSMFWLGWLGLASLALIGSALQLRRHSKRLVITNASFVLGCVSGLMAVSLILTYELTIGVVVLVLAGLLIAPRWVQGVERRRSKS